MSLIQQTLEQFELEDKLKVAPESGELVKAMARLLTLLLEQLEKNEGLEVPKNNPDNKIKQPIPYPS